MRQCELALCLKTPIKMHAGKRVITHELDSGGNEAVLSPLPIRSRALWPREALQLLEPQRERPVPAPPLGHRHLCPLLCLSLFHCSIRPLRISAARKIPSLLSPGRVRCGQQGRGFPCCCCPSGEHSFVQVSTHQIHTYKHWCFHIFAWQ